MTKQKKFKNRVRARMGREGVNYTKALKSESQGDLAYALVDARERGSMSEVLRLTRDRFLGHGWTRVGNLLIEALWPLDLWGLDGLGPEELREARASAVTRVLSQWEEGDVGDAQVQEFSPEIRASAKAALFADPGSWRWIDPPEASNRPLSEEDGEWYEDASDGMKVGVVVRTPHISEGDVLMGLWEQAPDISDHFGSPRRKPSVADEVRRVLLEEGLIRKTETTENIEESGGSLSDPGVLDTLEELHGSSVVKEVAALEIKRLRGKLIAAGIDPNTV